jgi:hypothetical protein
LGVSFAVGLEGNISGIVTDEIADQLYWRISGPAGSSLVKVFKNTRLVRVVVMRSKKTAVGRCEVDRWQVLMRADVSSIRAANKTSRNRSS